MKLALFNLGLLGHLNPTLLLVEELIKGGAEVTYHAPAEFEKMLRATGAKFQAYDSLFHRGLDSSGASSTLPTPARLMDEAGFALPQFRKFLQAERPDAVLYDMMVHGARWAAEEAGIPAVRLHPSYAQNEQYRVDWPFAKDPAALTQFAKIRDRVVKQFGVPEVAMNDTLALFAELSIVFIPREFQPRGELFDRSFVFVGPSLVPREDLSAMDWDFLKGGPVLYVSLGTIFNGRPDFFRTCAQAFRDSRWRVVMAIGDKVKREELGALPSNIFAGSYLPQLAILEKTDCFITHGGMTSVQGAVHFGVPMVACPQMREQEESASRLAELGLGINLHGANLTPSLMREAAEKVASAPAYRATALSFRDKVRAAGGAERAAKAILSFVSIGNAGANQ